MSRGVQGGVPGGFRGVSRGVQGVFGVRSGWVFGRGHEGSGGFKKIQECSGGFGVQEGSGGFKWRQGVQGGAILAQAVHCSRVRRFCVCEDFFCVLQRVGASFEGAEAVREVAHSPKSCRSLAPKEAVEVEPGNVPTQSIEPPTVGFADVEDEVKRLEAVIEVLGACTPKISKQRCGSLEPKPVETCKLFFERAKKRVQRAQKVVDKAFTQRAVHEEEEENTLWP